MELVFPIISVASIVIAAISLYVALIHGKRQIQTMISVRKEIETTSSDTQELIARIGRLFGAAEKAGLEVVFPDRNEALRHFRHFLEDEPEEVAIVGSSLLGLLMFAKGFEEIVCRNPSKFKFILTHPEFSHAREGPEGRDNNVIEGEIVEAIHKLTHWGVPVDSIQLYKGSPTVFMIATSERMLLNPYPYGMEAYHSFCIEVSSRGFIYPHYLERHFRKIWGSECSEKCSDFLQRQSQASGPCTP